MVQASQESHNFSPLLAQAKPKYEVSSGFVLVIHVQSCKTGATKAA